MATEYGEGGGISVVMDGPYGSTAGGGSMKLATITAPVANWKGGTSPYSQVVNVGGVSVNSKVDLQLSVAQMNQLRNYEICFTTENNDGTVTLYAIGDKPTMDLEFQATVSEVTA